MYNQKMLFLPGVCSGVSYPFINSVRLQARREAQSICCAWIEPQTAVSMASDSERRVTFIWTTNKTTRLRVHLKFKKSCLTKKSTISITSHLTNLCLATKLLLIMLSIKVKTSLAAVVLWLSHFQWIKNNSPWQIHFQFKLHAFSPQSADSLIKPCSWYSV